MRLLHAVAFSKLPWFKPTNVISLKTQPHAVNACVKRSSQRSLIDTLINFLDYFQQESNNKEQNGLNRNKLQMKFNTIYKLQPVHIFEL